MDVGTHSRGSGKRQAPETARVRETRRRARQRYGRRRYAEDPEFRSWTLRRNAQNRRAQPDIWYGRYWFKHAALVKVRSHRRYVKERWAADRVRRPRTGRAWRLNAETSAGRNPAYPHFRHSLVSEDRSQAVRIPRSPAMESGLKWRAWSEIPACGA
jgi:hypothetical protein